MKTRVRIRMSPQLRRNLDPGWTVNGPLRDYLRNATDLLAHEAQRDAPEDLGTMRDSHVALVDRSDPAQWGRVEVRARTSQGAPYPLFVHEGTRPHFPPIEAIRPWAERHGIEPGALAASIARRGTRANPWLVRAYERILPRLRNLGRLRDMIRDRWNRN